MIPSAFEYQRAASVDDAIARLQAAGGEARVIAGGHSLVPLMKLRLSEPKVLVDITRIPGLAGLRDADGQIEIGAGTVHHQIAVSALLSERCPVVAETAAAIGDQQVRNRGTIGGSLAHADPAADYPAVMLAIDADVLVKGPRGGRTVKAVDFFQGVFTVDLRPDELVTAVRFAPVRAAAYAKLQQRASRFAIVGVAAALEMVDGVVRDARVAVTGAGSHAVRLANVEAVLTGQLLSSSLIESAAATADADLEDVASDLHASEEYRRAMIRVFTRRAVEKARSRA